LKEEGVKVTFDGDSSSFLLACKKKIPGQHFPNLDMLTNLLTNKKDSKKATPSIEVLCKY